MLIYAPVWYLDPCQLVDKVASDMSIGADATGWNATHHCRHAGVL